MLVVLVRVSFVSLLTLSLSHNPANVEVLLFHLSAPAMTILGTNRYFPQLQQLLILGLFAGLFVLPRAVTDASPSDPSYQLVWSDEFTLPDYSAPDSSIWNHEAGPGAVIGGNNELEYYTAELNNSFILNRTLILQSLHQPDYALSGYNFTSARVDSLGTVELYLGYVEARIRVLTMADGHWPAFWMLGQCAQPYPNCGEIDIMEQVNGPTGNSHGNGKQQCGTLWSNPGGINGSAPIGPYHQAGGCVEVKDSTAQWGDDWHVYACQVECDIDRLLGWTVATYSTSTFGGDAGFNCYQTPTDPFYLVINLAEGGDNTVAVPDRSAFPTQLQLDWVRVWQQDDGQSYINARNAVPLPTASSGGAFAAGGSSSTSSCSSTSLIESSSGSSTNSQMEKAGAITTPCVVLMLLLLCSVQA